MDFIIKSTVLSTVTTILIIAFFITNHEIIKYILYVAANAMLFYTTFAIHNKITKFDLPIPVMVLIRSLKFSAFAFTIHATRKIYDIYYIRMYAILIFFIMVDAARSIAYEYIRKNFFDKLLTGYAMNILKFERYILYSIGKMNRTEYNAYIPCIEEFYKRGKPAECDANMLFDVWLGKPVIINEEETEDHIIDRNDNPDNDINNEGVMTLESEGNMNFENKEDIMGNEEDFIVDDERYQIIKINENSKKEEDCLLEPKYGKEEGFIFDDEFYGIYGSLYGERLSNRDSNSIIKKKVGFKEFSDQSDAFGDHEPISKSISMETLANTFPLRDASELFRILSFNAHCKKMGKTTFKANIKQIQNERFNLYRSIDDYLSLIFKCNRAMLVLEIVFFYMILTECYKLEFFYISILISLIVFSIRTTIEDIYESFFFIVFSHPYDAGDRVFLDDENLIVRQINLVSTEFEKWNGERVIMSNRYVCTKILRNIKRSLPQQWRLILNISASTKKSKLCEIKKDLYDFVNRSDKYISVRMNINELQDCNMMQLYVDFQHIRNFQNGYFMWKNHSRYIRRLMKLLSDNNIHYFPIAFEIELDGKWRNVIDDIVKSK
ncbi:Mechanosensitive ion channel protein 10 [Astathelohania contejeani]|uniref:Mechanosensitive ion channel protein 10 n=1 Tax=Astathelohania contejeani TaxID=164912 RepID=A0ABQ7HX86_9MICR|nr:Mechanosensitive ion channel protein 10 [Thelohania contejeani]